MFMLGEFIFLEMSPPFGAVKGNPRELPSIISSFLIFFLRLPPMILNPQH
jgi:hypothetical protein